MKKRLFGILLSVIFMFSLIGCTGEKAGDGDTNSVNNATLDEFNIVLDWYPNAVHGFIYEAIEKGYYAEEGLKVNIQFPSNTNDAISLTAAGKVEVGIYYLQDVILTKANQNVPIKVIGTVVQSPLNIILSLSEKNINEPKDLVGKTIGYAGNEISEITIRNLIEGAGGSVDNINLVDVGFDLMSAMTTGNVDATVGGMVNHEVPAMEEAGFDVNYFYPSDYNIPNYYELVVVTGEKQVSENSDKLERFLRASKKGFDDMKANPDEALQILLKNQNTENFPLNENVEKKSFEVLLPVMETKDNLFLSQDLNVWQENIDWLYEQDLIDEKIAAEDIVVNFDK